MTTSASLPTLPSIRAKELERAASAKNESGDAAAWPTSSALSESRGPSIDGGLFPPRLPPQNNDPAIRGEHAPSAAASSRVDNRRRSEQLEALQRKERMVFGGLPPLESSVACDAIHRCVVTTCSFLNSFIADVNAADEGIDHKLTVLEKQMALLESKVASVPDLFPTDGDRENRENGNDEKEACDDKVD
ncbi:hypothetical protein ACHAW5_008218 [Stephanodiscus triporus]|uniref:Uncharacterized protein n=1 Tax=Stephanodiscus triporus TaxID=2934178 RepID=A0ABD3MDH2_9STRA